MLVGREKKVKVHTPYDDDRTWDNWRQWVKKKEKGNVKMKITYGPKGV